MRIKVLLGMALSLACLAWALREVDFTRLWELIRGINPWYVLLAAFWLGLHFLLRAWRWRTILRPAGLAGWSALWSANLIGFAANNIFPLRAGELIRCYVLGRLSPVPVPAVLATVLLERIMDGMALLMILFAALALAEPRASAGSFNLVSLRSTGLGLFVLYLAVLAFLAALWRWPGAVAGWVTRLAARLSPGLAKRAAGVLEAFHRGLGLLGGGVSLHLVLVQTGLIWAASWVMYVFFLPAVGLPLSFFMGAMAIAGAGLGTVVPAGPGYVGTYQLAVTWALMMAGAGYQGAVAFAIIFWAVNYFLVVAGGFFAAWKNGLALNSLGRLGSKQKGALLD